MRLFLIEDEPTKDSSLINRLHPELMQAIATTELMRAGWVEPPQIATYDLSTLAQQILGILAETGGTRISELVDRLIRNGAFRSIEQNTLIEVLRGLKASELIEQLSSGEVLLAPPGEQLVNHYEFYSAFATEKEYAVLHNGRPIGLLPLLSLPQPQDHLLLGGRRWQVIEVDHSRSEVLVKPAIGKKPPRFAGAVGYVHDQVRAKMREILLTNEEYPYLNAYGVKCLDNARRAASAARLGNSSVVSLSDDRCLWFTWAGTRTQWTLKAMLETLGVQVGFTDYGTNDLALELRMSADLASRKINDLGSSSISPRSPRELAERLPVRQLRKFDAFLSDDLLVSALATDFVNIESAMQLCKWATNCACGSG
jgi:ATP-dependent helicase Lhr and Lhr-like helicase